MVKTTQVLDPAEWVWCSFNPGKVLDVDTKVAALVPHCLWWLDNRTRACVCVAVSVVMTIHLFDLLEVAEAAKILRRCDKNDDGVIGVAEFDAYYKVKAEEMARFHKARAAAHNSKVPETSPAGGASKKDAATPDERFSTARAMKKFNQLDSDGDGFVDGDEVG